MLRTSEASFKKVAKLKILRALLFGSNRLEIENISFRSIFDHLLCYLHLIDSVLANEFDEIYKLKQSLPCNFWKFLPDAFVV